MTTYPILTFIQSFVKFQNVDSEIQMKDDGLQHILYMLLLFDLRGESHDIHTYILTYLHTYLLTNQVIESA